MTTEKIFGALHSLELPGPLYRLRARLMRRYWTPARVARYLDARIPALGCVGAVRLCRSVRDLGAPHDAVATAREILDPHVWDGDGHHLTMWRRRGSTDFRHWTQDPRWVEANPHEAARWGVHRSGTKGHPTVTPSGPKRPPRMPGSLPVA